MGDRYLVLSTVPVMMDGANQDEWAAMLETTRAYRERLLRRVFQDGKPKLVVADGEHAARELRRLGYAGVVEIKQSAADPGFGIRDAGLAARTLLGLGASEIRGERVDVPRSHLTWVARAWEGTSGDRVITASDKGNRGKAFAIAAPNWARKAETHFTRENQALLEEMIARLAESGEPLPTESVSSYVQRRQGCSTRYDLARQQGAGRPACGLPEPVRFEGTLPAAGSF